MKKYKVAFIISLLPYAYIIFHAVRAIFIGSEFMFSTTYGWGAFVLELLIGVYLLIQIPILPVLLAYQSAYLIFRKAEDRKAIWFYTALGAILSLLFVSLSFLSEINGNMNDQIQEREKKNRLMAIIENADETIGYNLASIHKNEITVETGLSTNTILIDYDTNTVTFLYFTHAYNYQEYSLTENKHITDKKVQFQSELESPGKTFTTFFIDYNHRGLTAAVELVMEDGSVYSLDNMTDESERLEGVFLNVR